MTEAGNPLIAEDVVNAEIAKFHGFLEGRQGLDHELPADAVAVAVTELLPQLLALPKEAGAEEVVVDFGKNKVGRRSQIEVAGTDGFRWSLSASSNLGDQDTFLPGIHTAMLYKFSPSPRSTNALPPQTYRLASITSIDMKPTPVQEVEHSFYGWQRGEKAFSHSAFNTGQAVDLARAFINEFKAAPKKL